MPAIPKPRPKALERKDAAADLAAEDRRQRAICHARSQGQCEVVEKHSILSYFRCHRRATEVHHLIGGIGRRNKGKSLLAAHRLDVCKTCHEDITRHVLVPVGEGREYAVHVFFERRR